MRESIAQLRDRFAKGRCAAEDLERIAAELVSRSSRSAASLSQEVRAEIARRCGDITPPAVSDGDETEKAEEPAFRIGDWIFDEQQAAIVRAPPSARLVVNAPPGTGKTSIACGRIAWLLKEKDMPPHMIWLFSFTRTAIAELRDRIATLTDSNVQAHHVITATIDSKAWQLIQGFTGRGSEMLASGYSRTIKETIELLRSGNPDVLERLREVRHLVVDEAQDLVGVRAELMLVLIDALPPCAGVTILRDEAQAIYGFSEREEDEEDEEVAAGTDAHRRMVECLLLRVHPSFTERTLSRIYRTRKRKLRTLFIDVREELLQKQNEDATGCPALMVERIRVLRDDEAGSVEDDHPKLGELVLFPRRLELLKAASQLGSAGQAFRLRTSGLPKALAPWLAVLLSTWEARSMSREEFLARWTRVIGILGPHQPGQAIAWELLRRHAPRRAGIDLVGLRAVLSRSAPPLEFLIADVGFTGGILSTIHASKGREADHVRLMLPELWDGMKGDLAEYGRVLFVGASRARETLTAKTIPQRKAKYIERQRVLEALQPAGKVKYRARFEIGREEDVDVGSPVSRAVSGSKDQAARTQLMFAEGCGSMEELRADCRGRESGWRYELRSTQPGPQPVIARLSQEFNNELSRAAKVLWPDMALERPPYVEHLFSLGARTVVVNDGDERLENLHDPFKASGFWLAPIVIGLPTVPFFPRSFQE